jgi:hypothetical protein
MKKSNIPAWVNDPSTQYKVFAMLGDMEQDMGRDKGKYDDMIAKMKDMRNRMDGWTEWQLRRKITKDKYQTVFITMG